MQATVEQYDEPVVVLQGVDGFGVCKLQDFAWFRLGFIAVEDVNA